MPFLLLLLLGGGAVAAAAAAKRRWETDVGEEGATITFVRPGGAAPPPQPSRVAPFTITPAARPVAPAPPRQPTGVVAAGRFTGKYGTTRSGTHVHKGIDISAKNGTPVHAINNGVVQAIYPDGVRYGYGNSILLRHPDGKRSFYAHLSGFAVQPGQQVAKGNIIGYVGSTQKRVRGGRILPNPRPHMPPHLHMEVHTDMFVKDGEPVIAENLPNRMDPLLYMKQVGSQPVTEFV